MRFYDDIAYDADYNGIVLSEEEGVYGSINMYMSHSKVAVGIHCMSDTCFVVMIYGITCCCFLLAGRYCTTAAQFNTRVPMPVHGTTLFTLCAKVCICIWLPLPGAYS